MAQLSISTAVVFQGLQASYRAGQVLSKREGITGRGKDHRLNRRRQGTVKELSEWLKHYEKQFLEGTICRKRAAKIIARFEKALEKKRVQTGR